MCVLFYIPEITYSFWSVIHSVCPPKTLTLAITFECMAINIHEENDVILWPIEFSLHLNEGFDLAQLRLICKTAIMAEAMKTSALCTEIIYHKRQNRSCFISYEYVHLFFHDRHEGLLPKHNNYHYFIGNAWWHRDFPLSVILKKKHFPSSNAPTRLSVHLLTVLYRTHFMSSP